MVYYVREESRGRLNEVAARLIFYDAVRSVQFEDDEKSTSGYIFCEDKQDYTGNTKS
jgi:hypothetical protein